MGTGQAGRREAKSTEAKGNQHGQEHRGWTGRSGRRGSGGERGQAGSWPGPQPRAPTSDGACRAARPAHEPGRDTDPTRATRDSAAWKPKVVNTIRKDPKLGRGWEVKGIKRHNLAQPANRTAVPRASEETSKQPKKTEQPQANQQLKQGQRPGEVGDSIQSPEDKRRPRDLFRLTSHPTSRRTSHASQMHTHVGPPPHPAKQAERPALRQTSKWPCVDPGWGGWRNRTRNV